MDKKYNIGKRFLFVPKKNLLAHIDNSEKETILGSNESRLLCYFIENNYRTIAREELISAIWRANDIYVENSSLTQSISTLRKALKDSPKQPFYIKTVPKLGYEFIASVVELSEFKIKKLRYKKRNETSPSFKQSELGVTSPQYIVFNTLLLQIIIIISTLISVVMLVLNVLS